MSGLLEGKVALVTGGSSGIGKATSIDFARNGARVVIADRKDVEGEEVAASIRRQGGDARFITTDVSQEDQVRDLFGAIDRAYPQLDVAFNNAGVSGKIGVKVPDILLPDWNDVIGTDLTGVFLCLKEEIPRMKAGGSVVNMSSIAGLIGTTLINPAYHASKFGVIGLTLAAALDHAVQKIRVNAICPGFIDTPMVRPFLDGNAELRDTILGQIPMRRLGTPEEVAAFVTWLASDQSRYVTGSTFTVDGGIIAQ